MASPPGGSTIAAGPVDADPGAASLGPYLKVSTSTTRSAVDGNSATTRPASSAAAGNANDRAGELTSSPPFTAGIPAAPLIRRLGGFLLLWQLPGIALG